MGVYIFVIWRVGIIDSTLWIIMRSCRTIILCQLNGRLSEVLFLNSRHRFTWVEIGLCRIAILLVWDSLMVTHILSWLYRQSKGKDIYKTQLSKRVRRPLPSLSLDQSLATLCQQLIVCVEAVITRRVGWQIVGPWFLPRVYPSSKVLTYPPFNTRRSIIVIMLCLDFCETLIPGILNFESRVEGSCALAHVWTRDQSGVCPWTLVRHLPRIESPRASMDQVVHLK